MRTLSPSKLSGGSLRLSVLRFYFHDGSVIVALQNSGLNDTDEV